MEKILESLKNLRSVEKDRKIISDFARTKFDEKFSSKRKGGTFICYSSFDIISDTSIRVNYIYGGSDIEFNDSFIVEL